MTGKSSARPDKSGKSRNSSAKSKVFAEVEILATKHEILKENYETLVKDFQCLEDCFKHGSEMNEWMKWHLQKELEANSQRLIMDLEKERSDKEEYKKEMESREGERDAAINDLRIKIQELLVAKEKKEVEYKELERTVSEKEAMINDLRITNQELLIAIEKEEEELKNMENKYGELTKRYDEAEKECSYLKSRCKAKNLTSLGGNDVTVKNEVIVVDDHNVTIRNEATVVDDRYVNNNTASDPIVISDESDAEDNTPPIRSNIFPQWAVKRPRKHYK